MAQARRRDGENSDGAVRPDLEARLVVLEIIAMTSLALALDTSENGSVEQARGVAGLIQETVRQRSREFGLSAEGQRAANSYADELLSTALFSLYPN